MGVYRLTGMAFLILTHVHTVWPITDGAVNMTPICKVEEPVLESNKRGTANSTVYMARLPRAMPPLAAAKAR